MKKNYLIIFNKIKTEKKDEDDEDDYDIVKDENKIVNINTANTTKQKKKCC